MGRRMRELKQAPNLVLTFISFFVVAAAGFAYLYAKKPAAISTGVDVAVAGSLVCVFISLIFLAISLKRKTETQ